MMRRGVRLEVHRVVDPLIRKQAGYADHPAFGLADVGKPLPAHVSGLLAPLAVTMLVYDQNALLPRSTRALSATLQPAVWRAGAQRAASIMPPLLLGARGVQGVA